MAKTKRPERLDPGPPQVTPDQGIALLRALVEKAESLLKARPISEDAYDGWRLLARNYLEKAFGMHSPNVSDITDVGVYGVKLPEKTWLENHRFESLTTQSQKLCSLIELLETELQLMGGHAPAVPSETMQGHRIFLVHGSNEGLLHEIARFLEQLDQDFLVLREQPNKGRTIIEKFEEYSAVGFAIVILSSDDRGGTADQPYEAQRPRARQNVILELGYFLGRLGRSRVCALYQSGVDIPSDYSGVIYVQLDERGAWKLQLARELRAAGLPVDMNRAL